MKNPALFAALTALTFLHCRATRGSDGSSEAALSSSTNTPTATALPQSPKTPEAKPCGLPTGLQESDWPRRLENTSPTETPVREPDADTIVLIPDTQYYVGCRNQHLARQMEFLNQKREERRLKAAIWLGDLTDHNTSEEWSFFASELAKVTKGLPLLLSTGNHDLGDNGSSNSRQSLLDEYFPVSWAKNHGVSFETFEPSSIESAYYSVPLGSVTIGILMLEWSPRAATVAWANRVLSAHPKERVIVSTHAYLYSDNTRYDFAKKHRTQKWNPLEYGTTTKNDDAEGNHDGELLWERLIRHHKNVFLTVNGHVLNDGTGYLETKGDAGNSVHQILANYQMLDEGGLGYLRLLELSPNGHTVFVKTYSPSLANYSLAPEQNFSFEVSPPLFAPKAK